MEKSAIYMLQMKHILTLPSIHQKGNYTSYYWLYKIFDYFSFKTIRKCCQCTKCTKILLLVLGLLALLVVLGVVLGLIPVYIQAASKLYLLINLKHDNSILN